ncbi:transcriptional regulator [Halomonas sp. IOP_31]|uniref:transcriptional regulator n=1 Tax=Halomonas sp. IOP_31 TaxID=2876584 RepID=UPI001E4F5F59|nr:Cro/CI family transcriptional regulator [Halomonas sp. IOP_31]MCD6006873.1 helix-turn-helix domain-containing protein [Halomonas sp. IOP_31]
MDTPISRLIKHFGTQEETALRLGVKQGTVSGWSTGRHGISEVHALKAERLTDGAITAVELCPRLAKVEAA